jgi:hypothetical protein
VESPSHTLGQALGQKSSRVDH